MLSYTSGGLPAHRVLGPVHVSKGGAPFPQDDQFCSPADKIRITESVSVATVKAGLIQLSQYTWSRTRAHGGLTDDEYLEPRPRWMEYPAPLTGPTARLVSRPTHRL